MEIPEFHDPVTGEIIEPEPLTGTLPTMALPGVGSLGGVVDALVTGAYVADLAGDIADFMGGVGPERYRGHREGQDRERLNQSMPRPGGQFEPPDPRNTESRHPRVKAVVDAVMHGIEAVTDRINPFN